MRPSVSLLLACALGASLSFLACDDAPSTKGGSPDAGADADAFALGEALTVPVVEGERTFVKLSATPEVVAIDDPASSTDWDLAFEGLEVFTNSGISGAGSASAFGPLDPVVFLDDVAPEVPFLVTDRTGGAFVRWYFYEGAPTHALLSRLHVFGVKDGDRLFKVQLLNYYGVRDNAPVAALYDVRYAELFPDGSASEPVEATALDGTLGGEGSASDAPGECIDLGTGARAMLTPDAAHASSAWHLCFRRENVSVNGEEGGPRGVTAVNLDADAIATETGADVRDRTPESERGRFDGVTASSFEGRAFRGDRAISAFSDLWIERGSDPVAPRRAAWFVTGADGRSKHLVGAARFEGATSSSVGAVVLRVKPVK